MTTEQRTKKKPNRLVKMLKWLDKTRFSIFDLTVFYLGYHIAVWVFGHLHWS